MDLAPLITQAGPWAAVIVLLLGGMKHMAERGKESDRKIDEFHKANQQREAALAEEIQRLHAERREDSNKLVGSVIDVLRDNAEALRMNARAFEKWTAESGAYHAQREKAQR